MRVLVIAGARPNFMKVAPILRSLRAGGHEGILVHTGQHFDATMSDAFFRDLSIPDPDFHLGVGSGTHAVQTAKIMETFEPVLLKVRPDFVLVVGDVNSTLACALVAAKLREQTGCRIVHVEAGLRANDWRMPEEVNRVLTDRLSDLLLTPSRDTHANLDAEGLDASKVVFVGNVMIDTLFDQLPAARALDMPKQLNVPSATYVVSTLHRPSNVDDRAALTTALRTLARVSTLHPVVLPLHPRTRRSAAEFGLQRELEQLIVTEPLGYRQMLGLTQGALAVLTDSGGLQEETTVLKVPCVTLREQTERPVTVTEGTNVMAPWPLTEDGVYEAFQRALARPRPASAPEGWDGKAAERIVAAMEAA
jgi:UDP-N-acetylglucosamine 2-epimerase (non-hydrolysing)